MKRISIFILLMVLLCSCGIRKDDLQGTISISFSSLHSELSKSVKSGLPDTNSFIVSVESSSGDVIFRGDFCDLPESLPVAPGSYTVSAISCEFTEPAFDRPQWGDSQIVLVSSDQAVHVELLCSQMNCGVRLHIDEGFLTDYPQSALFVKASEGKLMYSYSEKRTAYFRPGLISLMMTTGAKDETLLTRQLEKGEILDLTIKTAGTSQEGKSVISIKVDTARNYISETYTLGETSQQGGSEDNPLSVSQARSAIGSNDVWVGGYIVAGDLSKSNANFEGPFTSRTNFAIGPRKSTTSRDQCLSVELKSGSVRDALNLVDNPDLFGTHVLLKGDIVEAYFGIPGLKNISDFVIK